MDTLLPLNHTPLEYALQAAADEDLKVSLRTLYNPDTCPAHLLYQLAWAWSVDRWDDRWSESIKRSVIRSAFFVHAHKGTLGALRRVVEPFGYLIEVEEWWQTQPAGVPGTFALKLGVTDAGISEETYNELSSQIDDARPVSRHLTGLVISLESRGAFYLGCALQDGDELDVYPPAPPDLIVSGAIGRGGREHTIDTLDIAHG
ncbi:phage tail protein I [Pseudomonas soli]|jgi:phage tail P2-like protein|uniref:Phage tail protein I n=1 Tax=Pseudomonas soli TaxID=1306993 RepID=A0A1H9AER5_9PSED|nr:MULTISPECIES: phage tail protein I [Pseudomonas]AUY33538.1 phage tail protein I [Pseudomonas sp. PONIH3]MDT3714066.1 phage tail protein I [Pseudomonas soli]MDT3730784.1 phage tail protein I [Pseudomonas soli]MEE1880646.1 phage tail protein I [Pseudomonas soli]NBK38338.1 phage tail protein I [Pseudomonas soli]